MKALLIAAVVMLALPAAAEDIEVSEATITRGGQGWSTMTGVTVGAGASAVDGHIGWPGITARLLYGATDKIDLGGRFTFNYGHEGVLTDTVVPGLKLQAVLRVALVETSRVNLGLEMGLGPFFYFYRTTQVGLSFPIGVTMGIPVSSALSVAVSFDLPMYITFGPGSQFALPILPGVGIEYFIESQLAVQFYVKMGPTIDASRFAEFTLDTKVGLAYRF